MSIDALRGFDMFWITGGSAVWEAVFTFIGGAGAQILVEQMWHVPWEGLRFIDCVFPVFVFIAGLSYPFSHDKQVERGLSRGAMSVRVLKRMMILIILGIVYNGFLSADWHALGSFRYASVLGKIGIGWGLAALIYLYSSLRGRIAFCLGGLVVYAGLLLVVAPDAPVGASPTSLEGCLMGYLDRHFTPGALYCKVLEPSGPFVSFFAYPTALLGMLVGDLARVGRLTPSQKSLVIAAFGAGLLVLALAVSPICPIIKNLWTPSFALVTAGIGTLCFSLFHQLIDVWGFSRWAFPFRVIGTNAIAAYLLCRFVSFPALSKVFFGGVASLLGRYEEMVLALGAVALLWIILHFLYRHKVFFKT